jgi:hypothetical protein
MAAIRQEVPGTLGRLVVEWRQTIAKKVKERVKRPVGRPSEKVENFHHCNGKTRDKAAALGMGFVLGGSGYTGSLSLEKNPLALSHHPLDREGVDS